MIEYFEGAASNCFTRSSRKVRSFRLYKISRVLEKLLENIYIYLYMHFLPQNIQNLAKISTYIYMYIYIYVYIYIHTHRHIYIYTSSAINGYILFFHYKGQPGVTPTLDIYKQTP